MINYTWPGRFHLIWKDGLFYVTLWFFSRRLHWCNQKSDTGTGELKGWESMRA